MSDYFIVITVLAFELIFKIILHMNFPFTKPLNRQLNEQTKKNAHNPVNFKSVQVGLWNKFPFTIDTFPWFFKIYNGNYINI